MYDEVLRNDFVAYELMTEMLIKIKVFRYFCVRLEVIQRAL